MSNKTEFNCTLFDGFNVYESATVITENGLISDIIINEKPYEIKTLCDEFCNDVGSAFEKYQNKRFEVTGVVKTVGPDVHNKPSIELSDSVDGECYALCIFPNDDIYDEVSVGDTVTVKANFLVMSNWYGVVMKYSEIVEK